MDLFVVSFAAKYVCCCMDCCECYNDFNAMHFASCCGDKLRYTPWESVCCGLCSARATACSNCCGLCGPKTGEPLVYCTLVTCLMAGSGEQLATAINNGRAAWSARTMKA